MHVLDATVFSEKIFSYGTLQDEAVQLSTFGRKLNGTPDTLIGYQLSNIAITDPKVVAISGKAIHAILLYTGNEMDTIKGTVFDITLDELHAADKYEVADYKRVSAKLRSGHTAWVYVSVDSK